MHSTLRASPFVAVVAAALCALTASQARADSTLATVAHEASSGTLSGGGTARERLRLDLDPDLFADVAQVLGDNTQASSTLPAVMDFVSNLNAASSNSGGGSSGALSGVGIGLQVGTPTALTFKFGAGGNANIVLGIGLGFGYADFGRFFGLSLHGDYLFTLATLVNNGTIDLSAYLGPGIWLTLFNGSHYVFGGAGYVIAPGYDLIGIGGRLPIGLNLKFAAAPIEIYLELDPALFIFPVVGGFIGASLGFRWFF